MLRRIVLTVVLELSVLCLGWAQQGAPSQQVPDAPVPQANAGEQSTPPVTRGEGKPSKQQKDAGPAKGAPKSSLPGCEDTDPRKCGDNVGRDPLAFPEDTPPPRSDDHQATGTSSSRDTQIDLSPPGNDYEHPGSTEADSVTEFHPWDPHKAAKDIEVGNFYFKRGNYRAAEDRFRGALNWKPNDAEATFRLAETLAREHRDAEAVESYQAYLKILPNGEFAQQAQEAIARLKKK